jgi:hypothetical protein
LTTIKFARRALECRRAGASRSHLFAQLLMPILDAAHRRV